MVFIRMSNRTKIYVNKLLVQAQFTTAVPNLLSETFDEEKITTVLSLNYN